MGRQLIAGPLLMAEAATQVPPAHQEQLWGSVSYIKDILEGKGKLKQHF